MNRDEFEALIHDDLARRMRERVAIEEQKIINGDPAATPTAIDFSGVMPVAAATPAYADLPRWMLGIAEGRIDPKAIPQEGRRVWTFGGPMRPRFIKGESYHAIQPKPRPGVWCVLCEGTGRDHGRPCPYCSP